MSKFERDQQAIYNTVEQSAPFFDKFNEKGWEEYLKANRNHTDELMNDPDFVDRYVAHLTKFPGRTRSSTNILLKLYIEIETEGGYNIRPELKEWVLAGLKKIANGADVKEAFYNPEVPGKNIDLAKSFQARCYYEYLLKTGSGPEEARNSCEVDRGVSVSTLKRLINAWPLPDVSAKALGYLSNVDFTDVFSSSD